MGKQNLAKGQSAEQILCSLLEANHWIIQERNAYFRCGELDIVAIDPQGILAFIEVKSSWNSKGQRPAARVSGGKQHRIWKSAQVWCARRNIFDTACRFDVFGARKVEDSWLIEYLPNAFMGESSTW